MANRPISCGAVRPRSCAQRPRTQVRLKVFQGRNSISWAKSVLPVFIADSRGHPGSLLRLQIVDTASCSETRKTPGAQSGRPPVNRTAVTSDPYAPVNQTTPIRQMDNAFEGRPVNAPPLEYQYQRDRDYDTYRSPTYSRY